MDESITPVAPEAGGVASATQPPEPASQQAVQNQPASNEPTTQEPSTDENSEWLKAKGIDPTDPAAVAKVAAMYREAEKKMHEVTGKASQLENTLQQNPAQTDDAAQRVEKLERDLQLMKFQAATPDWKEHEPAMANKLMEVSPSGYSYAQLVNAGLFSLNDIYAMTKGNAPSAAPQQDVTNVLQSIANKQMAGGATGNAVNSAPAAGDVDPIMEGIRRNRSS